MVSQLRPPVPLASAARSRPPLYAVSGTVQVFTAPHRNFFTSVMVQAMRAAGQGMPVLVVQCLKGGIRQGVVHPMQLGQHLIWLRPDIPACIHGGDGVSAHREAIAALWHHTQERIMTGDYTLVVLDEISLAIRWGLVPEAEVLTLLRQRPAQVDVVMTGPEMPPSLLAIADQVTEFRRQFVG